MLQDREQIFQTVDAEDGFVRGFHECFGTLGIEMHPLMLYHRFLKAAVLFNYTRYPVIFLTGRSHLQFNLLLQLLGHLFELFKDETCNQDSNILLVALL